MYNDEEFELTLEEQNALASLPREMPPGDLLEAKVIRALRSEGHFRVAPARRSGSISAAVKIAAAIALFAGGVATGRYVLQSSDSRDSASVSAPASQNRDVEQNTPRTETRPVRRKETVVAEREMWL
ncbi:MAG TPA: hypothetical protein VFD22_15425 [Gemmatimonadaceae bacterium]|jgi:hypothetical protein|nr:hypothetical protein [Gemmatimonadaceae bacterium]